MSKKFSQSPAAWARPIALIVRADTTGAVLATTIIQSALDSGAKRVYLPPGNYLCGALTVPSGVEFFGAGWNSILTLPNAANVAQITCAGTYSHIHDLKLSGNGLNQSHTGSVSGIVLTAASVGCSVHDVWSDAASDWGFAIYGDRHLIANCKATEVKGATGAGAVRAGFLVADDIGGTASNVTLRNCTANSPTVAFTDGIIVSLGATNTTLDTCFALNNTYVGIKPKGDRTTIRGCYSTGNGEHGYQTQGAPKDLKILGCTAFSNGDAGFYLNTTVAGPATGWIIKDNTARNNGQISSGTIARYGFAFENAAACVNDGCIFEGNQAIDDQGTPTQQRGISVGSLGSWTNLQMQDNFAKGNVVDMIAGAALDVATFTKSGNTAFSSAANSKVFTRPTVSRLLRFGQLNVPLSSGTLTMSNDLQNPDGYRCRRAGSILALYASGNAAITAGSITFQVRVNGAISATFNTTLNTTNPQVLETSTSIRAVTFAANDIITVTCSSDAAFLPTGTTDYEVVVEIIEQ